MSQAQGKLPTGHDTCPAGRGSNRRQCVYNTANSGRHATSICMSSNQADAQQCSLKNESHFTPQSCSANVCTFIVDPLRTPHPRGSGTHVQDQLPHVQRGQTPYMRWPVIGRSEVDIPKSLTLSVNSYKGSSPRQSRAPHQHCCCILQPSSRPRAHTRKPPIPIQCCQKKHMAVLAGRWANHHPASALERGLPSCMRGVGPHAIHAKFSSLTCVHIYNSQRA